MNAVVKYGETKSKPQDSRGEIAEGQCEVQRGHRFQTFHMPMLAHLGIPAFCLGHSARCIGNWVQVVMLQSVAGHPQAHMTTHQLLS